MKLALAALLIVGLPAPAQGAGWPIYTVPASIAHDCSVDVTTPLAHFIASVPDRAVIQFQPGCYLASIAVADRERLMFDGNGATLYRNSPGKTAYLFQAVGGSDISVRNITLKSDEGACCVHGFSIQGVDGGSITHSTVKDVSGDFVYMQQGNGLPVTNYRISHDIFDSNLRQALTCIRCQYITYDHNTFYGVGANFLDMEGNTANDFKDHISLLDNDIHGTFNEFVIGTRNADHITIVGNHIYDDSLGLSTKGGDHWTIAENVAGASVSGGSFGLIRVAGSTDVFIAHNSQGFLATGSGAFVGMNGSHEVGVLDNELLGARSVFKFRPASSQFYLGPSSDYYEANNTGLVSSIWTLGNSAFRPREGTRNIPSTKGRWPSSKDYGW